MRQTPSSCRVGGYLLAICLAQLAAQMKMGYGFVLAPSITMHHQLRPHQYSGDDFRAFSSPSESSEPCVDMGDVGFVLLAGGTGSRMKATMPKQFLDLAGVPVLHHSLHLLLHVLPDYCQQQTDNDNNIVARPPPVVVLVLDPKYQPSYQSMVDKYQGRLVLANPGKERQGSVENGLAKLVEMSADDAASTDSSSSSPATSCNYVAIHDSARPLVTVAEILSVVRDAKQVGAAVLGVPCKATIKECRQNDNDSSADGVFVLRTVPRSRLWEVHTPQVIRIDTLLRGFEKVKKEDLQVTDDVSIVEALGEPVKLTLGEYTNLKITTPEDMNVAESILEQRNAPKIDLMA